MSSATPEQVVELNDPASGLRGYIVIHSTAVGPGGGGCRFWYYDSDADAEADSRRLAEGMTWKNAMAGLPFGGGKTVIRRPAGAFDRAALFQALGRAIDRLEGRYVTAEDVGTSIADMQQIATQTRFVAGLSEREDKAGGDPSPWTALGVFEAMAHAFRHAMGSDLAGVTVAVQGVGSVGQSLCGLLAGAGARLIVADIDAARCASLRQAYGAEIVSIDAIVGSDAQIFAPCALGGAMTPANVAEVRAKIICGAANNQLAVPEVADMLAERGIVYIPDFVANAGGMINVSAEYLGEAASQVRGRVMAIGPRVARILTEAEAAGLTPAATADREARRIVAQAAAAR